MSAYDEGRTRLLERRAAASPPARPANNWSDLNDRPRDTSLWIIGIVGAAVLLDRARGRRK